MASVDWKSIPKAALVDTLRNCNTGPSNLSRQDKADLIRIANAYLAARPEDREGFFVALQTEVEFQRTKKTKES